MSRQHAYPVAPLVRGHRGNHRAGYHNYPYGYGFLEFENGYFGPDRRLFDQDFDSDDFVDPRACLPIRQKGGRRKSGQGVSPEQYEPFLRSRMPAQNRDGLPFGKAMTRLFKDIGKAEEFYNTFVDSYEGEIGPLKRYASAELLTSLWIARVQGKPDSGAYEDGEEIPEEDKSYEQFEEKKRMLTRSLEAAAHPIISESRSPKNEDRTEGQKRLREKIQTAQNLIGTLLKGVPMKHIKCKSLLKELAMLKTLVDPEEEENRSLFKSGDESEADAGDDQDDGHRGGGGGNW